MPPGAELVMRFLTSVSRPSEIDRYLALFKSQRPESFAVMHISPSVVDHALDALVVALTFLSQLGLCPIVAFGAVNNRTANNSNGKRPTGTTSSSPAARAAERVRNRLGSDVPAQLATKDNAAELTRRDIIALIPLGDDADNSDVSPVADSDPVADRRFDALAQLVNMVAAKKLLFIGRRSGLQPRGGRVVSMIDVVREADILAPQLPDPQRRLLLQIRRMFTQIQHPMTVSITSPMDILRELFTVKGAGTLVRRAATIATHSHWQQLHQAQLAQLVTEAFAKPLAPHFFEHQLQRAYIADNYRGAAIITDSPLGPYLSKFAFTTVARGEGIGGDLWRAMNNDHAALFWKSRSDNPITAWYREQCDGLHRINIGTTPWTILWRGIAPTAIASVIEYCSSARSDFD
jgi:acetylglutamate synthase